jgi:hypothetical protein
MRKVVSYYRESSDPAFIVWQIEAKNVDGRKQIVHVTSDSSVVANEPWTTGKGRLRDVRDAMETGDIPSSSRDPLPRRSFINQHLRVRRGVADSALGI